MKARQHTCPLVPPDARPKLQAPTPRGKETRPFQARSSTKSQITSFQKTSLEAYIYCFHFLTRSTETVERSSREKDKRLSDVSERQRTRSLERSGQPVNNSFKLRLPNYASPSLSHWASANYGNEATTLTNSRVD